MSPANFGQSFELMRACVLLTSLLAVTLLARALKLWDSQTVKDMLSDLQARQSNIHLRAHSLPSIADAIHKNTAYSPSIEPLCIHRPSPIARPPIARCPPPIARVYGVHLPTPSATCLIWCSLLFPLPLASIHCLSSLLPKDARALKLAVYLMLGVQVFLYLVVALAEVRSTQHPSVRALHAA